MADDYEWALEDLVRKLTYKVTTDSKICDCGKVRARELIIEAREELLKDYIEVTK